MKLLLSVLFALVLLTPVKAEVIKEPPINKIKKWKLHHYLGVLVEYHLDDGTVIQFSHPVLSVQDASNECSKFRRSNKELILLVNDPVPIRYITSGNPTMYRFSIGQWIPIISKTFHE